MRRAMHLGGWAVSALAPMGGTAAAQAGDVAQPAVQVGRLAPAFTLPDQSGATHRLADTDKHVVQAYGVWGERQLQGKTFAGDLA